MVNIHGFSIKSGLSNSVIPRVKCKVHILQAEFVRRITRARAEYVQIRGISDRISWVNIHFEDL